MCECIEQLSKMTSVHQLLESINEVVDSDKDGNRIEYLEMILNDLISAQSEQEYRLNFEWLWMKVYLHACCKRKHQIKEWLVQVYQSFDEVTKIALRPTLVYGKYIGK